ncbi:hypothetical protein GCM10009038_37210 [Salinicola rhizosphaerae]|uniref:Uncharacterized protein n=1 Tax=Salinicola rhizosphaerae TaxID=1443141 RepID=A0ABQ3EDU1_9GAMM|nr:hypothetical protein GCM10009038_37210 [Salinicola rhizosphaerae]
MTASILSFLGMAWSNEISQNNFKYHMVGLSSGCEWAGNLSAKMPIEVNIERVWLYLSENWIQRLWI